MINPTHEARMDEYQRRDAHRRIENILRAYPQADWTLEEAQTALATLEGMVRVRQGDGAVCVSVTIASPSGGPDIEVSTRLPNAAVDLDQHAAR